MAIQPWNFPVQWSDPFSWTLSFKTEIISSESGKEQRRALRVYPRKSFSFKFDALPQHVEGFQFAMSTAQRKYVVMPEPVRKVRLTRAIPVNWAIIEVDKIEPWIAVGKYIALLHSNKAHVSEILDISGKTIYLAVGSGEAWPVRTRVSPAWKGLLSESMSYTFPTNRVAQGGVEFGVLPTEELATGGSPEVRNTAYRFERLFFKVNWNEPAEESFVQERQVIDYGRGAVALFAPVAYTGRTYSFDTALFSATAAHKLAEFFIRHKGRQGEFVFVPPVRITMKLAEPTSLSSNTIRLQGDLARRAYAADPTLRILAIKVKTTGQTILRRVRAAAQAPFNTTILTLDYPVPELISTDNVDSIYWASLGRFESDDLTIDWQTTEVATSRLSVRALEYQDSEYENDSGLDEGTKWLLDYYGADFVEDFILGPTDRVLNYQEPEFLLVVDGGTQYLIDTLTRYGAEQWVDQISRVINNQFPLFLEVR